MVFCLTPETRFEFCGVDDRFVIDERLHVQGKELAGRSETCAVDARRSSQRQCARIQPGRNDLVTYVVAGLRDRRGEQLFPSSRRHYAFRNPHQRWLFCESNDPIAFGDEEAMPASSSFGAWRIRVRFSNGRAARDHRRPGSNALLAFGGFLRRGCDRAERCHLTSRPCGVFGHSTAKW